jgi:RNA polymerase sigma-70 factor (ECF subfamily)
MDDFEGFVRSVEPRLRRALVATRGAELGREATAEALAYAWEHWDRVQALTNPVGYLYRVGQSRSRRRKVRLLPAPTEADRLPDVDPRLREVVRSLPEQQRVAVLLVHGYEWTHGEVAELLGVSPSTVSTHVQRGMATLRERLEVTVGA